MMRRLRARDGFTLIEVMVATLLLLVAMAGFVPFFLQGLNQSSSARYRSVATNIARERMEQVRQLDYREITTDAIEELKPLGDRLKTLEARFGTEDVMRGTTFTTHYTVSTGTDGLKNVTVMVDWVAPPKVSKISVTTLIHQQFLGPRGSRLTVEETTADDLGSPFRMFDSAPMTIEYDIAEADWGLCYPNPTTSPDSAKYGVYFRLVLWDDNGIPIELGEETDDYKISNAHLKREWDESGVLKRVYFELADVDPTAIPIPDGYWELQAQAYNAYDEPGNLWRLRLRRESGPPAAPIQFTATGQDDGKTIDLTWTPGSERDRDYFVLQRRIVDLTVPADFATIAEHLDPASISWADTSTLAPEQPSDPWGDLLHPHEYEYRLWAVDFSLSPKTGPASVTIGQLPPPPTTTTTLAPGVTTTVSSSTTTSSTSTTQVTPTTIPVYSVSIRNGSNKSWHVTIVGPSQVSPFTSDQNTTIAVPGLAQGDYLITASTPGRDNVVQSFSVPGQKDTIVLTIL